MNDEEQRKQFAIIIADIIQDLLQESDDLSDILEAASDEGFDIFLTVFSGIMIRRRDEEAKEEKARSLPIKFEFTDFDKEFLQSIGVKLPQEEADDSSDSFNED